MLNLYGTPSGSGSSIPFKAKRNWLSRLVCKLTGHDLEPGHFELRMTFERWDGQAVAVVMWIPLRCCRCGWSDNRYRTDPSVPPVKYELIPIPTPGPDKVWANLKLDKLTKEQHDQQHL